MEFAKQCPVCGAWVKSHDLDVVISLLKAHIENKHQKKEY